jgi:recombinational DNA repair protein (RecF pathway)
MYTTYSTDAFVFSRTGVGEADVRVELFTRDFGIVRAKATGARAEASKLRYSLQTLSHCKVTLVSGKRGWRLTGAEKVYQPLHEREMGGIDVPRVSRLVVLIRSLVAAEEPSEGVFDVLSAEVSKVHTDDDELALVASILTLLGYMKGGSGMETAELVAFWRTQISSSRKDVLAVVNTTLSANHIAQK